MAAVLPSSLLSLLKKSSLDDHEQILSECDKVLKSAKGADVETQHVKLVALLKLDRYEEAAKFVENNIGADLRKKVELEYAYALYKTGRLKEAADLSASLKSRGAHHVEAQSRYRLEESTRTSELYKRIRSQKLDSEEFDLRVNQGAIDAQAQWLGHLDMGPIRRPGREDLEAFETAYNAACGCIARGEYAQAEMLLKRARELCKHSEDLTDQQKAEELLPISVQQLFVLQSQGKMLEAETLSREINVQEASDMSTRKIGLNNVMLTRPMINPFLAHRTFHSAPKVLQNDKLFTYQNIALESNKSTIDLQTFKYDGVMSSTAKALKAHPLPSLSPEVLLASYFNAAAHAKNETGKAAIRNVLPELEKRPNDIGLILTLVQMYVIDGDVTSAVELVEQFFGRLDDSVADAEDDIRFHPMLVSLMTSLYTHRGQKGGVKQELAKAAAYWRSKPNAPTTLLTAAGVSLLESQSQEDAELASAIFSKLREQQQEDKATIAGYVASHAQDDEALSGSDADKLTSTSELIRNIDIDALENRGIPQSSNALTIAQLGPARKRATAEGGEPKPKRIRKSRLPKDYDENKKPDPERWLPMRDRSYYRPPKGKKKGKRDDRTQGGVVDESLNVDAKSAAATVATGTGGGANKKKKGKGKK
ncbi:putative signal recognition particle protein [Cladophialophora carrionii]|uniref:Signal recognition particle subunit SRP72 n=1 Tax=Cladophialophora carrionii TaxID=86049 RepID=A0A1C1CM66_9EURO|nr:putative signal recognition particle protein [Cladophialophora carrionii]